MRRSLAILVSALALGAGPCSGYDVPEENADTGDASADCGAAPCLDMVAIQILRADNAPFFAGTYEFAATMPDQSAFRITCDLTYLEQGLSCTFGDVSAMTAQLDMSGQVIWVRVLAAPESLELAVTYNGFEIGQRAIVPAYDEVYANGESCPPCYQADASMAVESW